MEGNSATGTPHPRECTSKNGTPTQTKIEQVSARVIEPRSRTSLSQSWKQETRFQEGLAVTHPNGKSLNH